MRSSPTFSDTKFNLSFFLTTPAKKPRTECCCQSVAFMIAAMVVPFGCRSIPRTVSCFDEALVDLREAAFWVATLDAAGDLVTFRFSLEDGAVRDCLVVCFADFDLCLLVAMWPSLCQRQRALPLTQSPAIGRGERRRNRSFLLQRRFSTEAASSRRRRLGSAARYPSSRYALGRCAQMHRSAAALEVLGGDT